jgi:threonine synthase
MNYFSTRDKSIDFSFKDIFLRGLAPDGGLFLPSEVRKYDKNEIKELSKLSYRDLATEIIFNFCKPDLDKDKLKSLIEKSYRNFKVKEVVELKKIGGINILELYNGPTLAFKDIAMQIIGNLYDELNVAKENKVNVVVATSGDTGSAAISALNDRKNINVFVLHPHNKISNIQRKIMTTIGSNNVYNVAVKGTFDDCQKIVKDMFSDNEFRESINMSGVNSINWARIICQIVYYFYSAFKFPNQKVNFSVPTGNFGDVYAGYMAKKMGLPMDKLIIATNENNILQRVINTGEYKPNKVKASLSPSMDIQVSSNFERLLYDILDNDDKKVGSLMRDLTLNGSYKLNEKEIKVIKRDFCVEKISDIETMDIIKNFELKYNYVLDPHTATAVGASRKVKNNSDTVVLATAHPYKFLETIELAIGKKIDPPSQLSSFMEKKERFDIIENQILEIKDYILKKIA